MHDTTQDDRLAFATTEQVASILQLNVQTVRRWIATGRLPVVRFGPRTQRVPIDFLNRQLQHLTTDPNTNRHHHDTH
jgi:excisionase family DNA binding protein